MTAYTLGQITADQAINYNSATDTIIFPAGTTASKLLVLFDPNSPLITMIFYSGPGGGSFGPGLAGENDVTFPDGSKMFIGTTGADSIAGVSLKDALFGGPGVDTLSGGAGGDLLDGGPGADLLTGGEGADNFRVYPGGSPPILGSMDTVTDWERVDALSIGAAGTGENYVESTAATFAAALAYANSQAAAGKQLIAVQVGGDVIAFAELGRDDGVETGIVLSGRTLADVDFFNFIQAGDMPPPVLSPPPPPPPPPPPASFTPPSLPAPAQFVAFAADGLLSGNMDSVHLSDLLRAVLTQASSDTLQLGLGANLGLTLSGTGFDYANNVLIGGVVTHLSFTDVPAPHTGLTLDLSVPNISASLFQPWLTADATQTALQTILAGSDRLGGSTGADVIHGFGGADLLYGAGGGDTIYGGTGNDVIYAGLVGGGEADAAPTYLRGEEGDDYIVGSQAFDDANGNMGNDTISTGEGDDFSVGGKDNDLLFGDNGADIVWGNLGNDTCVGGNGPDQVRGGQGDDWVYGGNGADFVSGDRGNDTIVGGAGADVFHGSQDAGIDRVLDFNLDEGDRVQLDPGTTFSVSQSGADTVIDMGNGNQMILVGVQMTTLTPGWIFGA